MISVYYNYLKNAKTVSKFWKNNTQIFFNFDIQVLRSGWWFTFTIHVHIIYSCWGHCLWSNSWHPDQFEFLLKRGNFLVFLAVYSWLLCNGIIGHYVKHFIWMFSFFLPFLQINNSKQFSESPHVSMLRLVLSPVCRKVHSCSCTFS